MSCCAGHCCDSQSLQLGAIINCFSPLGVHTATSHPVRATPQRGDFQTSFSLILPSPVSKFCGVFGNKVSPSCFWRQPKAVAIAYLVWASLCLLWLLECLPWTSSHTLTWPKLESSVNRELSWGIAFIRLACGHVCGAFSRLVIGVGGLNSLWEVLPQEWSWDGGPGSYKQADWKSHQEQGRQ